MWILRARYLLYLPGYIVAAGNTRPTSPKFGVYEYEQILETFKKSGFVVLSEARKQDREIEPYAQKITAQVRQLLKEGVPPDHITVVGACKARGLRCWCLHTSEIATLTLFLSLPALPTKAF